MATDAEDTSLGHCVEFADDTKCDAKCFHQGKAVGEIDQAVCSKICQVPGRSGAKCNVIKTVSPTKDGMYLTRSKVMQSGLKDMADADPWHALSHARKQRQICHFLQGKGKSDE